MNVALFVCGYLLVGTLAGAAVVHGFRDRLGYTASASVAGLLRSLLGAATASAWAVAAGFMAMVMSIPFGGPHGASTATEIIMAVLWFAGLVPLRVVEWRILARYIGPTFRGRAVYLAALSSFVVDLGAVAIKWTFEM